MPPIRPIAAVHYARPEDGDVSCLIAPPYDVLDDAARSELLARAEHNIVGIDLPHMPPKSVGPPHVYEAAGATFRRWLVAGILVRRQRPALFVYRQTFREPAPGGAVRRRLGLIANVDLRPLGAAADGEGGVRPHERTFPSPAEDRLRLMRATGAQLSPVFGIHADPDRSVRRRLERTAVGEPWLRADTDHDGVAHEVWVLDDPAEIAAMAGSLAGRDIFIADGHHRYSSALAHRNALAAQPGGLPADHPAQRCLFVLVALEDPGLLILPTHRVFGGMPGYRLDRLVRAAAGRMHLRPPGTAAGGAAGGGGRPGPGGDLAGRLEALQHALPGVGHHAIGLYDPAEDAVLLATTADQDPLADVFADRAPAWRQLDVVVVQHLLVERICRPCFCPPGSEPDWTFPHTLDQVVRACREGGGQLAVLMRPTPLEAVRRVSEAGELMPPKSTFFHPKLATGLVISLLA